MRNKPKYFVINVDGTFTDGTTIIGNAISKVFDKDGWAGINEICRDIEVILIGNKEEISEELFNSYFVSGMPLFLWGMDTKIITDFVKTQEIKERLVENLGFKNVIYFSSAWRDRALLKQSALSIVPNGLRAEMTKASNITLRSFGGRGCVLDACLAVRDHLAYQD